MKLLAPLALLLSASFAAAQVQLPQNLPCYIPPIGHTQINNPWTSSDWGFSLPMPLGFSFPFAGATYTEIQVCQLGFVVMGNGPAGSSHYGEHDHVTYLTQEPQARICPLWAQGFPGGEVYYRTVPAAGTEPAHCIITWKDMVGSTGPLTFQLVLFDGGLVQVYHDDRVTDALAPTTWLVGASPGNGATPNPISYAAQPFSTGSNPTFHDHGVWATQTQFVPYPLGETTEWWLPTTAAGWFVIPAYNCATKTSYGEGCYELPRMIRESFPVNTPLADLANTSWRFDYVNQGTGRYLITPVAPQYDAVTAATNGTNIVLSPPTHSYPLGASVWDDATNVYALPTAAFPNGISTPGGSTTTISINSNAKVYFGTVPNAAYGYNGSVHNGILLGFTDVMPCLACFHNDLDPGPATGGGAIWLEYPSPSGGIRVTWDQIPNYVIASQGIPPVLNDIQLEIFPGGQTMIMSFGPHLGCAGTDSNEAIVGFSAGNGDLLTPSTDWSAIPAGGVMSGDGSVAPKLDLDARPVLGSTVAAEITDLGTGTIGGLVALSWQSAPGGIPLTSLGMPGCSFYLDPGASIGLVLLGYSGGGTLSWSFQVPWSLLVNTPLYLQGATLTPTIHNPTGILVTNAVQAIVGQ